MSAGEDDQVWVFDPHTVAAEVIQDDDGLPVLAIYDGSSRVELPAGRDPMMAATAVDRIGAAMWEYMMAVRAVGPVKPSGPVPRRRRRPGGQADMGNSNPGGPGCPGVDGEDDR